MKKYGVCVTFNFNEYYASSSGGQETEIMVVL